MAEYVRKCLECGTIVTDDSKFCTRCGSPLPDFIPLSLGNASGTPAPAGWDRPLADDYGAGRSQQPQPAYQPQPRQPEPAYQPQPAYQPNQVARGNTASYRGFRKDEVSPYAGPADTAPPYGAPQYTDPYREQGSTRQTFRTAIVLGILAGLIAVVVFFVATGRLNLPADLSDGGANGSGGESVLSEHAQAAADFPRTWEGEFVGYSLNVKTRSVTCGVQMEFTQVGEDGSLEGTCTILANSAIAVKGNDVYRIKGVINWETNTLEVWGYEWIRQGDSDYMRRYTGTYDPAAGSIAGTTEVVDTGEHVSDWHMYC